jgi:hypothetical protein
VAGLTSRRTSSACWGRGGIIGDAEQKVDARGVVVEGYERVLGWEDLVDRTVPVGSCAGGSRVGGYAAGSAGTGATIKVVGTASASARRISASIARRPSTLALPMVPAGVTISAAGE